MTNTNHSRRQFLRQTTSASLALSATQVALGESKKINYNLTGGYFQFTENTLHFYLKNGHFFESISVLDKGDVLQGHFIFTGNEIPQVISFSHSTFEKLVCFVASDTDLNPVYWFYRFSLSAEKTHFEFLAKLDACKTDQLSRKLFHETEIIEVIVPCKNSNYFYENEYGLCLLLRDEITYERRFAFLNLRDLETPIRAFDCEMNSQIPGFLWPFHKPQKSNEPLIFMGVAYGQGLGFYRPHFSVAEGTFYFEFLCAVSHENQIHPQWQFQFPKLSSVPFFGRDIETPLCVFYPSYDFLTPCLMIHTTKNSLGLLTFTDNFQGVKSLCVSDEKIFDDFQLISYLRSRDPATGRFQDVLFGYDRVNHQWSAISVEKNGCDNQYKFIKNQMNDSEILSHREDQNAPENEALSLWKKFNNFASTAENFQFLAQDENQSSYDPGEFGFYLSQTSEIGNAKWHSYSLKLQQGKAFLVVKKQRKMHPVMFQSKAKQPALRGLEDSDITKTVTAVTYSIPNGFPLAPGDLIFSSNGWTSVTPKEQTPPSNIPANCKKIITVFSDTDGGLCAGKTILIDGENKNAKNLAPGSNTLHHFRTHTQKKENLENHLVLPHISVQTPEGTAIPHLTIFAEPAPTVFVTESESDSILLGPRYAKTLLGTSYRILGIGTELGFAQRFFGGTENSKFPLDVRREILSFLALDMSQFFDSKVFVRDQGQTHELTALVGKSIVPWATAHLTFFMDNLLPFFAAEFPKFLEAAKNTGLTQEQKIPLFNWVHGSARACTPADIQRVITAFQDLHDDIQGSVVSESLHLSKYQLIKYSKDDLVTFQNFFFHYFPTVAAILQNKINLHEAEIHRLKRGASGDSPTTAAIRAKKMEIELIFFRYIVDRMSKNPGEFFNHLAPYAIFPPLDMSF